LSIERKHQSAKNARSTYQFITFPPIWEEIEAIRDTAFAILPQMTYNALSPGAGCRGFLCPIYEGQRSPTNLKTASQRGVGD